jgi:aspartokinase-like uncharacterized kinase
MKATPLVMKVGGSLLDWPGLPSRLREELARWNGAGRPVVLVVGGGALADVIRDLDRIHAIGETDSHLLAIRSLEVSARILSLLLGSLPVAQDLDDLQDLWERNPSVILAPLRFMEEDEATQTDPLPRMWDVTSDSIAARLARVLEADLLLLKSVEPTDPCRLEGAARSGWVDPWFPTEARSLRRVLFQNLRSNSEPVTVWPPVAEV